MNKQIFISVIIISLITLFTRAFPFIFFRNRKPPEIIIFIEKYIPPMIMVILVIYCLKDISFTNIPFGIPEVLSVLVVAGIHLWKGNALVSILGGTALYMILVQTNIIYRLFI